MRSDVYRGELLMITAICLLVSVHPCGHSDMLPATEPVSTSYRS